MSFEKGKMNFSVIELTDGCNTDKLIQNLKSESYSSSEPSFGEPKVDFTSGVSLVKPSDSSEINEDEFIKGGLPYFAIRTRELKVDSALVRETVDRKIRDLEKEGVEVNSKMKREIKQEVADALSVDATQKMSGFRCVISNDMRMLFSDAVSMTKVEEVVMETLLTSIEMGTFGSSSSMMRMSPEFLYTMKSGKGVDSYIPVRMNNFETIDGLGYDFLTYLFMGSEVENFFEKGVIVKFCGNIELEDCRDSQVGAKKVLLKEGAPSISDEVVSALSSGKKVKSADVMISFGGEVYSVTIDKDLFFRKFSTDKKDDGIDAESVFADRITSVRLFVDGLKGLFGKFVESEEINERLILGWLKERQSRSTVDVA